VDFIFVLIKLFSPGVMAEALYQATSEYRPKIGDFAPTGKGRLTNNFMWILLLLLLLIKLG